LRGRLEILGPIGAADLGRPLALGVDDVEQALHALEAEGVVLRGRFTPGSAEREWCDRRLLARIHRYTLNRLRSEIEPVSPADFMRFLLRWQHVDPTERLAGPGGVAAAIEQLDGHPVAASAWESHVLPARVRDYSPAWLDALCLTGRVAWARGPGAASGRTGGPIRSTPVAIFLREHAAAWLAAVAATTDGLGANARAVLDDLSRAGASFCAEIAGRTRLIRAHLDLALGELVAAGRITADGFGGLRALLSASARRSRNRMGRATANSIEGFGRWSVLRRAGETEDAVDAAELQARALLRRWGVVFRRLADAEVGLVPWRDLDAVFRRLEARGEVRGGRFVSGFYGHQYALPEAVAQLRAVRRAPADGALIVVGGCDPLNLTGLVTSGERVPAVPANRVLYCDGVPVAALEAGRPRLLVEAEGAGSAWLAALVQPRAARRPRWSARGHPLAAVAGGARLRPQARP
jgi:ATP-dependent Lhr-like helicase